MANNTNHAYKKGHKEAEVEKDYFFTQARLKQKLFYPKKCVNYDKSDLQQNSVKDPNSERKIPKSNIKFQNVKKEKNTKKPKIATLLTFLPKQRKILQRFYPR